MFPYYISIGCDYDTFWNKSPELAIAYRKAHKLFVEQRNQELWLQGLYFNNALNVSLRNAFAKKGSTPEKYIDKPIELFEKKTVSSEREIEDKRQSVIDALTNWKKACDKANGGD